MLRSNLVTNTSPLSSDDSEHTIEYQRSRVVQSTITSTSENTINWTKLGRQRPLLPPHAGYETRNIYLIGLPGSGKTTVGRELAKLLGKPHFDIDEDLLEKQWSLQQHTVASKYAALGDEGFIEAEGGETLQLNVESHIVSLTGSNPLHAKAMKHLSKDGIFVYLDTPIEFVVRRCEEMKMDRLVGQQTKSLPEILLYRLQFYEHYYDLRILINKDQSPLDIANVIVTRLKIQEEERHFQSYRSTRGNVPDDDQVVEFMDVIKEGVAPDGGIYIAHSFNPFTLAELERLLNLAYEEKTLRIMERFPLGTLHPSDLKQLLYSAYSAFSNREVLPVTHLWRNQYLIETYHGPTASFKDFSLQLLPKLLEHAISSANDISKARIGILVATSGDTGTAALNGFSHLIDTPVIVLYPKDGVSIVQKAQMQTAQGQHLCVLGVDNDFDFCQSCVEQILNDSKLQEEFSRILPNLKLISTNSINWAYFLPQVVFAFSSYLNLVEQQVIKLGDLVDICIPIGNFGNILSCIYARRLGLPIRRLIAASNEHNVNTNFVRTGTYDMRKHQFNKTISSNLERFLYLITNGDHKLIKTLFELLAQNQMFTVSPDLHKKIQEEIQLGWTSDEECFKIIDRVYRETNRARLIDPHTAVAIDVALKYSDSDTTEKQIPMLILSTGHYAKFPVTIMKALNIDYSPSTDTFESMLTKLNLHLASSSLRVANQMHTELMKLMHKKPTQTTCVNANKDEVIMEIKKMLEKAFHH